VFGARQTVPGGRIVRTMGIVGRASRSAWQNFVYNIRHLATLERIA